MQAGKGAPITGDRFLSCIFFMPKTTKGRCNELNSEASRKADQEILNSEEARDLMRRYRSAYHREWRKRNPDYYLAQKRKRQAQREAREAAKKEASNE